MVKDTQIHKYHNMSLNCCIYLLNTILCVLASSMVCQQGIWGADRHWATVSQSLVHSPSLPQLWPLLCRLTRHDKGKGILSITVCVFAYSITSHILCSCIYNQDITFFSSSPCRNSLTSGLCWWESRLRTPALWLLMAGYCFHFSDIHVHLCVHLCTWWCALCFIIYFIVFILFLQEVIFYKVIDYILHGKEDIKVIP